MRPEKGWEGFFALPHDVADERGRDEFAHVVLDWRDDFLEEARGIGRVPLDPERPFVTMLILIRDN